MTETGFTDLENNLWYFNGGVVLPAYKTISNSNKISIMPPVEKYVLPLTQHIGVIGKPLVSIGDGVKKGQKLSDSDNLISAPIHSPVSGVVEAIEKLPIPHPSGIASECIVINNNFKEEWVERSPVADNYQQMTSHDLRNIIKNAGIVGLGGAVFPTSVKQTEIDIHTLIINGVECEPFITCDDVLMRAHAQEIIMGADIIGHIIKARECIIAIEDNKPEAIAAITKATENDGTGFFTVAIIPTLYPSGGERQLIQLITGKEVPQNRIPPDIDVICQNIGTAHAIYKAVYFDEPLISRIVTITGQGVKKPQNIEASIGTPINECLEFCGGITDNSKSLVMGGPMMGFTLENDALPITKATNCLLVTTDEEIFCKPEQPHLPCIRCGLCTEACPANLLPQQLYWYASSKNFEKANEYDLFDCIECGCCDYVCPSKIPLVQYYHYAKYEILDQQRDKFKSDQARLRYEYRNLRLERIKIERERKLKNKENQLRINTQDNDITNKQNLITAALARVSEKKLVNKMVKKNTTDLSIEQQELISQIDMRRASTQKETNHDA